MAEVVITGVQGEPRQPLVHDGDENALVAPGRQKMCFLQKTLLSFPQAIDANASVLHFLARLWLEEAALFTNGGNVSGLAYICILLFLEVLVRQHIVFFVVLFVTGKFLIAGLQLL